MNKNSVKDRICLALDMLDENEILKVVEQMCEYIGYFKLNYAFTRYGKDLIDRILQYNVKIFLDLKIHDIPHTVSGYVEAVTDLGVHIVTVHAAGGMDMMKTIADSARNIAIMTGKKTPKFIAVTLLTNIDKQILNHELKVPGSIEDEVVRKMGMAMDAGLDGIVCSPAELLEINSKIPMNCFCITPGIRSVKSNTDDHRRVASFREAIKAGSDLLVVGRDLLVSNDPIEYAKSIIDEIMQGK